MESIRGAAEFDAKHEVEADSNFGAMLNELGGLREKLGTEQQKISTQLKSKNNDLVWRRVELGNLQAKIEGAAEGLGEHAAAVADKQTAEGIGGIEPQLEQPEED